MDVRVFDVLCCLFLSKNPFLPSAGSILHRSENDLGDLQPGGAQADYTRDTVQRALSLESKELTVGHILLRCFSHGASSCDKVWESSMGKQGTRE